MSFLMTEKGVLITVIDEGLKILMLLLVITHS